MRRVVVVVLALLVVVLVAPASADYQGLRQYGAPRPGDRIVPPVRPFYPVYRPLPLDIRPFEYAPLPYQHYYQRELRKRWHRWPPPASHSFQGSSPRCPRFFCSE